MSMLAAVEGGRRILAATLVDRCVVLDAENTQDDSGGSTTVLVPRALDVGCRFGALTETDIRVIAGTAHGPATAVLTVPLEVEINEGSYIQNVADDSEFWLVVGDRTPSSNMAIGRRLLIREASWR